MLISVLTSCARHPLYQQVAPNFQQIIPAHMQVKPAAPKVFQYNYQEPVRSSSNSNLAKQLTTGIDDSVITVKLKDDTNSHARLGKRYFSASGYECRKYSIKTGGEYTACYIGGRWLETGSILNH